MQAPIDIAAWLRRVLLGLPLVLVAVRLYNHGHHAAFYVIVLVGGPALEVVVRLIESLKRRRAETWPLASANVESRTVSRVGDGEYSCHRGEIAYSYSVDNEYWSGFYARDFDKEDEAWAFVDALKGKTVLVNYNPENHAVSDLTDSAIRAVISDPLVLRERRLVRIPALDWLWPGPKR